MGRSNYNLELSRRRAEAVRVGKVRQRAGSMEPLACVASMVTRGPMAVEDERTAEVCVRATIDPRLEVEAPRLVVEVPAVRVESLRRTHVQA